MAQFDADLELVATTNKNFAPVDHWEDLSLDKTEYVALPKLIAKNKRTVQSGTEFQWELKTTTEGNAHMTKPYATETTHNATTMKKATLPHRHIRTSWAIDERVLAANRSPARLVNIMKVKKSGARADLAVLAENQVWGKPTGDDDDENMHGMKYHIVSSTSAAGYNGTIDSAFTLKYGFTSSTYPTNGANWTDTFKQHTKTDLVRKIRLACHKSTFRNPMDVPTYSSGGYRRGMYTYLDAIMQLEEECEKQNTNLQNDLASKDGMVMIRKTPVTYVPQLDDSTGTFLPFYGIDWGTMEFTFLEGEEFKELEPMRNPLSARVIVVPTYATVNLLNYNPRNHFVLVKN